MDNKNALYKRPTTCFHCGNDVPMMTVGEYSYGSQDVGDWEFEFSFKYEMLACPVCKKVALRQLYNDETMIEEDAFNLPVRYGEERIIFPACTYESHCVPQKVREAYEAALKIKNIDGWGCLGELRRTLELLLADKGATKWGLGDKIEEIAQKGLLPDVLKEASQYVKTLGDSAVHNKKDHVDQMEVEAMTEFVGYIIEYLYIVPEKIASFSAQTGIKPAN